MLKGCDVSNYQSTIPGLDGMDFVIIKASEGVGWKDPMLDEHTNVVTAHNKLYGFYHYARPETGNTAEAEADYFLSLVGHHAGKAIFALDWENLALGVDISWARAWCDRVYSRTGVKPLIYTSAGYADRLQTLLEGDYGLWVASWGVGSPYTGVYPTYAMWQYTSTPIDLDYFNGDRNAWFKYCGSGNAVQEKPKPVGKSIDQLANEVISGVWGNGEERKNRLIASGYDYDAVQARVNQIYSQSTAEYYTIQQGDTLSSIAARYGTTWQNLANINGIANPNLIYAGNAIRVK